VNGKEIDERVGMWKGGQQSKEKRKDEEEKRDAVPRWRAFWCSTLFLVEEKRGEGGKGEGRMMGGKMGRKTANKTQEGKPKPTMKRRGRRSVGWIETRRKNDDDNDDDGDGKEEKTR